MKTLQMPQNLRDTLHCIPSKVYVDSLITCLKNVQPIFGPVTYLERGRKAWKFGGGGQTVIQGLSMELVYASNSAKIGSAGALHVEMGLPGTLITL